MRIRTQMSRYNKSQVEKVAIEGKKAHNKPVPALHEAAVMAGEIIARLNNDHKTTSEEVIKYYKPKYLKDRGVI